jgi:hypothetical protein
MIWFNSIFFICKGVQVSFYENRILYLKYLFYLKNSGCYFQDACLNQYKNFIKIILKERKKKNIKVLYNYIK